MLACPRCGATNPASARFCIECGAHIADTRGSRREVRKIVTAVFCDVTGSTALGERLDPESLRRVMMRYFERMRTVVAAHGGTVEKFIGDAVMAVFGVPESHEDDAVRAVTAALEMQHELERLNDELERHWGIRLLARIGVNTGEVLAGDAGTGHGFVTGDPINVSARLEQAAEPGEVLIGRPTYEFVRDAVRVESVPPLRLKGKATPVEAFRLVDVVAGAPGRVRRRVAFVDRQTELELVRSALRRASEERRATLVTLVGEPGVGKSRLVTEAAAGLSEQALVMAGATSEHGERSPFTPLGAALRTGLGLKPDDSPGEVKARLEAAVTNFDNADLVTQWMAPLLDAGGEEGTVDDTAWAARKLLESMASSTPVVLVLEDLHWAEPALLDLVDHVLTWSRDVPILLICVGRPELLDQRPWWGEPRTNVVPIALDHLTHSDATLLVENLLPGGNVAARASARVIETAEGNPLFIEEMLGMLVDEGLLRQDDGAWVPTGAFSQLPMPPTLESLLVARIDQLGADDAAVLQRASVIGLVFSTTSLVGVSPPAERAGVPACLLRAARRDLIRAEPSGFLGGEAFRFRHALIRDAAYRMLTKQDRAVLHERFAAWLERAAGDFAVEHEELLAYHLEAAHRDRAVIGVQDDHGRALASRAAALLATAGRRALVREDVHAASGLLARSVALLDPTDSRRAGLLHELGNAQHRAGLLSEASETFTAAAAAADATGDARLRTSVLVSHRRLKLLTEPSAVEDAFEDARHAIAEFERAGDDAGLTHVWQLVALIEWDRGRVAACEEALKRALLHARSAGDEQAEAFNLGSLMSVALLGPTPVAEGVALCEDALTWAGTRRSLEGRTLRALAWFRAMEGDFQQARSHVARSIAIFEDLGQPEWISAGFQVLGFVEKLAGDNDASECALRRSYDILRGEGDTTHLSMAAALLAHALQALGRNDEAETLTRVSEGLAATEDVDTQSHWRTARAKVLADRGALDQAELLAREAIRLGRGSEMYPYADVLTDAGTVLAQAGCRAEAVELLERALARYERKGDVVSAERARLRVAGVTGGSARGSGTRGT